ncbi:MAG: DNA processing protein [Candidatus Paceibacteria bacterium]
MKTNNRLLRLEHTSPSFPLALTQIEGPPEKLWARGQLRWMGAGIPRIAIVGTRAPTPYGEAQAQRFGRELALAGVTVVSGLARGIDQAAHQASLDAGGGTIAVLGSGLDRPWPKVPLVDEIAAKGLLLSEYEPTTPPRPRHFPMRNRLISGLCDGLVVIEAAAASGSLISARWAVDQGRDVFALPGRVDHPMSAGCHRLLREGAGLVESPSELLELVYGNRVTTRADSQLPTDSDSIQSSRIESALRGETLSADELAQTLEGSIPELLTELVQLELGGRVVRAPGGLYRLP